jgi:hypothetical protein
MKVANAEYIASIVGGVDAESGVKGKAEQLQSGEDPYAVLMICDNGIIFECNNAAGDLLDCKPNKLTWQHIYTILPQLADMSLMRGNQLNPHLRFLSRLGYTFETVGMTGAHFVSTVFFNEIETLGRHFLRIILRPVFPSQALA